MRWQGRGLAAICLSLGIGLLPAGWGGTQERAAPPFVSKEVGNVFFAGDTVRFAAIGPLGQEKRLAVRVTDYTGQVVKEGAFPANAIVLGALPRGYYELSLAQPDRAAAPVPFVVVPRPHPDPAGRTATDAALSWLVPEAHFAEGAELLRRAGFRWVRDRMAWGEVEPERGKFAWGKYDRSATLQTRHGLDVYQVFHAIPRWARADGATNRFPDDLRDAYRFTKAAAEHFRGRVRAWEVWNEADIPAFSIDPASEYAAFLKAAYLGFKAGDSHLPITQVSFALPSDRFGQGLVDNGTAAYYDIYNYHIYDDPKNYAARAQGHLARMAASGAIGRPVWLTEAGIPLHAVDGTLTSDEKRRQAEFIPKSYVESLAHGTDKHFFFVFPHYLENGVEFGTLDADLKPYPGYAAVATLTDALGAAKYRGEIVFQQPGLHLYVFDNGSGYTLVAWSDLPEIKVPLALTPAGRRLLGKLRVWNVVGTPAPLDADMRGGAPRLALSPSPLYLRLPYDALAAAISEPLPAAGPVAAPQHDDLPEIVVRLRLPEARPDKSAEAFRLHAGQPTPLSVEIYNFGQRTFTGSVVLSGPEGWTLSRHELAVATLPPLGRQLETVSLTPSTGGEARRLLRGVAQTADGAKSSPAVVEIEVD